MEEPESWIRFIFAVSVSEILIMANPRVFPVPWSLPVLISHWEDFPKAAAEAGHSCALPRIPCPALSPLSYQITGTIRSS